MAAGTGWKTLAVFACALGGFAGRVHMPDGYPRASVGAVRAWAAETKDEVVEAEMLKDLDILREVNVPRDRELLQRLRFWERLPMLERMRMLETTPPPEPSGKEEK